MHAAAAQGQLQEASRGKPRPRHSSVPSTGEGVTPTLGHRGLETMGVTPCQRARDCQLITTFSIRTVNIPRKELCLGPGWPSRRPRSWDLLQLGSYRQALVTRQKVRFLGMSSWPFPRTLISPIPTLPQTQTLMRLRKNSLRRLPRAPSELRFKADTNQPRK